jgi:hypothetical protein
MFSLASHCAASNCEVKMNWSTQKKISPPIRFATTVATIYSVAARRIPTPVRIGMLACHRSR